MVDSEEKVTQNWLAGITTGGKALGPLPLKLAMSSVHAGFLKNLKVSLLFQITIIKERKKSRKLYKIEATK